MRLVLVRHAAPVINTARPASEWPISDAGREAARNLAGDFAQFRIRTIVSSEEPKCVETAREVASQLGIAFRAAPNLHEHERETMEWFGEEAWHELLREFFDNPETLVFGNETARDALDRFSSGVDAVIRATGAVDGSTAIVSHGTVISLYAARQLGVHPYSIWAGLKMPDYVELEV